MVYSDVETSQLFEETRVRVADSNTNFVKDSIRLKFINLKIFNCYQKRKQLAPFLLSFTRI